METNDLTTEVLKEIRDAVRGTNARVDQTNVCLEAQTERLDRRITESEVRTATAINQLRGTLVDVKDLLETRLDIRDRVERCEREIEVIKVRLTG